VTATAAATFPIPVTTTSNPSGTYAASPSVADTTRNLGAVTLGTRGTVSPAGRAAVRVPARTRAHTADRR
jgi:hypothetical protein